MTTEKRGLVRRLFSIRVGAMLVRNTVVSSFVFVIGLAVLWVLVNRFAVDPVAAAGIGFVVSNTLHYTLGRSWIFPGSDRKIHTGYALFLTNAAVGLVVTMGLFALFLAYTPLHYLVARVIVSVFAGLIVFVLNAVLNFRQV